MNSEYGFDGKLINPNDIGSGDYVVESPPIRGIGSHGIKCYGTYPGLVHSLNYNKNMAIVTHGGTIGAVSLNQLRKASINDFILGW